MRNLRMVALTPVAEMGKICSLLVARNAVSDEGMTRPTP
jgi:hypothetical protein